jgi:hypothetical protein
MHSGVRRSSTLQEISSTVWLCEVAHRGKEFLRMIKCNISSTISLFCLLRIYIYIFWPRSLCKLLMIRAQLMKETSITFANSTAFFDCELRLKGQEVNRANKLRPSRTGVICEFGLVPRPSGFLAEPSFSSLSKHTWPEPEIAHQREKEFLWPAAPIATASLAALYLTQFSPRNLIHRRRWLNGNRHSRAPSA